MCVCVCVCVYQLILWRYMGNGRVQKVTELTGHQVCVCVCMCVCVRAQTHACARTHRQQTHTQARVLHMARSPDGTTVVSAAADETLRFWRIFGSPTRSASKLKDEQVCVCICVCICAGVCLCALYVRGGVCVCTCVWVYVDACMYVCEYMFMHAYTCGAVYTRQGLLTHPVYPNTPCVP